MKGKSKIKEFEARLKSIRQRHGITKATENGAIVATRREAKAIGQIVGAKTMRSITATGRRCWLITRSCPYQELRYTGEFI